MSASNNDDFTPAQELSLGLPPVLTEFIQVKQNSTEPTQRAANVSTEIET